MVLGDTLLQRHVTSRPATARLHACFIDEQVEQIDEDRDYFNKLLGVRHEKRTIYWPIVAANREDTIKGLRRGPDCVWLEPTNPSYQPIRVSIGKNLHVFGVVRHCNHTLR